MEVFKIYLALGFITFVCATPVQDIGQEKTLELDEDPIAYLKDAVISFLDGILETDNFKASENVEVTRNNYQPDEVASRSLDYEDKIENYLKTHDVNFKLPAGTSLAVGARNLDKDELDFTLKFTGRKVDEARKSKLKKILLPILVFVLLKAITVVPLVLGVLILKAFNALQLSFISFVISSGLAIFQLCKKIAENNAQAHIAAHGPFEAPAQHLARSIDGAQDIAYSAYAPK